MAKKKDYLKMFVEYARENDVWYSVCSEGSIDSITIFADDGDRDYEPSLFHLLGSKAAYDWLVECVKESEE